MRAAKPMHRYLGFSDALEPNFPIGIGQTINSIDCQRFESRLEGKDY